MDKQKERRILDAFLAVQGVSASHVAPCERPDFVITLGGELVGVEVTQIVEASPRQAIAPQQWEAEAKRVCSATRKAFEAHHGDPVVVHMQFKSESDMGMFRAPNLPADLARLVVDHLAAQAAPWPLQADALVNHPHPALEMLYAARLPRGASDWRLGGASSARPATCEDVRATIAGKESLVPVYRQKAPAIWLLVDCDLLGQGVSLLGPEGACPVESSFDAVFCIDFYGACRKISA